MNQPDKAINAEIESLALKTVILDAADIAALGDVFRALERIDHKALAYGEIFAPLLRAMKGFLEEVILGEEKDLAPFEEGVMTLQSLCRDLGRQSRKTLDLNPLLGRLCREKPGDGCGQDPVASEEPKASKEEKENVRAVFRPFHTIKRVSCFLSLNRIN